MPESVPGPLDADSWPFLDIKAHLPSAPVRVSEGGQHAWQEGLSLGGAPRTGEPEPSRSQGVRVPAMEVRVPR